MNVLQKRNHSHLRKHIFSPQIITSLNVLPNGVVEVKTKEWHEYWGENDYLQPLLHHLFQSRLEWITSRFERTKLNQYVCDYFRLLETCLTGYTVGSVDSSFLNKIISFETFYISTLNCNNTVAGLFSTRNPNYLLHRIPNNTEHEDSKYLPVICLRAENTQNACLYYHYRRIPIRDYRNTQLFVYPAVVSDKTDNARFNSIDALFRALTRKSDPWVNIRSNKIAKSVFTKLIYSFNKPIISLLDLGCGTAKVSTELCVQVHKEIKTPFNVTLVDGIPSRFSIARYFYKHYKVFDAIHYHRKDVLSWLQNVPNDSKQYDITLLLRVCDTWCQYTAKSFLHKQIADSLKLFETETLLIPTSQQIQNFPNRIVHTLRKVSTETGTAYLQPALRDYFKAVFLCCNIYAEIQRNDEIVMPIRLFSEDSLLLKDCTSIIERIMRYSRYLLIEDSDVSYELLYRHALKKGLLHLEFTNIPQRGSLSYCTLISKKSFLKIQP